MVTIKTELKLGISIIDKLTDEEIGVINDLMKFKIKVLVEEQKRIIDNELIRLHQLLSNKKLPELTQANLSGGIIYLEYIKKELFDGEKE